MDNRGKKLILIGCLFIILSISLVMYNKYEDDKAGIKSKEVYNKIQETFKEDTELSLEEDFSTEMKKINIVGNNYIGIITIPTLNLQLPIISDWDYNKMKISPCRYYGSLLTDDLVICAHAYNNLFGNIKKLKQKDKLIFTDINQKNYLYEVELIDVLSPSDVTLMIESEFDLTLYTCTDDNLNRVTVRLNRLNWKLAKN